MLEKLVPMLGTIITAAATIAAVILGRLILKKSIKDTRTYPYHRQFMTLILVLLGLFISIALLPLPYEVRSQILSVLGILLSGVIALSSTTLVGNAMAGIMLRMMHGFRAGDFISFEQRMGRITDFGIFHTEMQLVSRDLVTIPNMLLVQKSVEVTRRGGSFINLAVSVGYDVSHTKVEKALTEAAERCELTEPFVFIEGLQDYSIRYRVYGLLEETNERLSRTSALHAAVLDVLHGEGIEIMSPQITDRREYGKEHHFMPSVQQSDAREAAEPADIEEIAFDRAEEAASIEQLHAVEDKLNHELEALTEAAAEGKVKKENLKSEREKIESQLGRLKEEIEKREKDKENQRIEEESST